MVCLIIVYVMFQHFGYQISSKVLLSSSSKMERLEAIINIPALLFCLAAIVVIPPPFVCLIVLALVGAHLVPRLGAEKDVGVLDFIIPPDSVVHTAPAQGLEGIVDVGQGDPSTGEEVAEHGLIGKLVRSSHG